MGKIIDQESKDSSYIHDNQAFDQPQDCSVGVPETPDKNLHGENYRDGNSRENQPGNCVTQNQWVLWVADICGSIPSLRLAVPHRKEAF